MTSVPQPGPQIVPSSGPRRTALDVLVLLAVLAAAFSGLAARWFAVDFQLFGEQPDRTDYLEGALSAAAAALVLALLGALVGRLLGVSRWVWVVLVVLVGLLALLALSTWVNSAGVAPGDYPVDAGEAIGLGALFPTTYPLMLLAVVAVGVALRRRLRERSRPARR